jgi:AcrR family transcriptional regulator
MPRRAGQPPLSAERILAAALQLVDRDGLDALSMRRLAAELDVDPMAIYHHLPNKSTLLQRLVAQLFADLPVRVAAATAPLPASDWPARVRVWAQAYRALGRAHPNLILRVVADPAAVEVAAAHANDSLVDALAGARLPPADTDLAVGLIVDYCNGVVLAEAAAPVPDGGAAFDFGLDVIVAGLRTRSPARSTGARRQPARRS